MAYRSREAIAYCFVFSNLTLLKAALKAVIIFIYKHYVSFAQIFKSKASQASNRTILSSVVLIHVLSGFWSLLLSVFGGFDSLYEMEHF